jgi:hypothetical protein
MASKEVTTDVGEIWQSAVSRYEKITGVEISSMTPARNVDDVLGFTQERSDIFGHFRHKVQDISRQQPGSDRKGWKLPGLGSVLGEGKNSYICTCSVEILILWTAVVVSSQHCHLHSGHISHTGR